MPLVPGYRLGPYEILAPIGAGGMGEVYKAKDIKLDREVAIKVLPNALARDPERLARFEREAKVLASLNHPNIATIYAIEESPEGKAIAMELVSGNTLKGQIPLETALNYAKQIAEALEAAHEKGITHRDLKPANIMITPERVVKVLDFGLASVPSRDAAGSDPANSPTITMAATQAGVIMGTAAYMSPEQAAGKTVDKRADVWSYGVVLYEMLTGKRLFDGETISHTLAAVLTTQPDLAALPAKVCPVVERCLRKDPRARWRDIGDVRVEIEALIADPRRAAERDRRAAPKPLWKRATPVLGAGILAAAIASFVVWNFKPSTPQTITRFQIALGEGQQFTNAGRSVVAISPDGTQIVYVANLKLYVRSMADLEARPIPGSEIDSNGVANPIFSPDGRSIVFFAAGDSTLKRIAVSGGAAVTICKAGNPFGMAWGPDGIVFGAGSQGIQRVSPNGGKPELLVTAKAGELAVHPEILPGGQAVLFTLVSGSSGASAPFDNAQIILQNLKSGARKNLIEGGSAARYLPSGHIVYAQGGTLFAVPFDGQRLEVTGGPVPVVNGVLRGPPSGVADFSFSNTGSLIYVPGPASAGSSSDSLVLVDRKGGVESLKLPPAAYAYPRISHDAKRIVYETDDGKEVVIWVYELSGASAPRRLTFGGSNRYPIWSADDQRVAFQSDRGGDLGIFWQRADGNGTVERLTKPEKGVSHAPDSWSPDGQQLSFTVYKVDAAEVWTFSLRDRKATPFANSPSLTSEGSVFSPDGRWLAYESNETGTSEIYMRPFPATATKYQISKGFSVHPFWSTSGKELFFSTGPTSFAVVNITTQPGVTFSSRAPVPRGGLSGTATGPRTYDILPDGRFIGVVPARQIQAGASQIQVVLNWFEDLRQRAPVR